MLKFVFKCVGSSENSIALTCMYCYMCGFILAESLYPCEKATNQRYNKEIPRYDTHFNTLYTKYFRRVPWQIYCVVYVLLHVLLFAWSYCCGNSVIYYIVNDIVDYVLLLILMVLVYY